MFSDRAKAPGGRRSPRVHQRHLDHAVLFVGPPHEAAAVLDPDAHLRTEVEPTAQVREPLAHNRGGDDGVDLDTGDVVAARGQRARQVPSAARADHQRLGAGPQGVDQTRPLVEQVVPFLLGKPRQIEAGNAGGGVGVDDDVRRPAVPIPRERDAREAVPADEALARQFLALGVFHVDERDGRVHANQHQQRARQRRSPDESLAAFRQAEPTQGGDRIEERRHDHGVRPAQSIEERDEEEAARGRACQVGEIHAVHALDGLGDRQRDGRAGGEEGQGAGEIDQRKRAVTHLAAQPEHHHQRHQRQRRVHARDHAELGEKWTPPFRHHVRKDASHPQPEQRDRDGQEGEVVIENDREDPRQRQLQQQRGERRQSDAQIQRAPIEEWFVHVTKADSNLLC